eukprot:scaffold158261_cov62-Attheya_sp.AAC.4
MQAFWDQLATSWNFSKKKETNKTRHETKFVGTHPSCIQISAWATVQYGVQGEDTVYASLASLSINKIRSGVTIVSKKLALYSRQASVPFQV